MTNEGEKNAMTEGKMCGWEEGIKEGRKEEAKQRVLRKSIYCLIADEV